MVHYILPSVGSDIQLDPPAYGKWAGRHCPHCRRANGRIHSGLRHRPVSDVKVSAVPQRRMRCPWCGLTWTLCPAGVRLGYHRSDRTIGLGMLWYMLGLSYRHTQEVLEAMECPSSKSSIERDVAAAGQKVQELHHQAPRMQVRVLGVDGTGAAMAGQDAGVLFFVGLDGGGRLIGVVPVHEEQTHEVRRHVQRVMAQVKAQELRTDEHSVYEGIVPEEQHRLCLTHWRKSKGKRAYDLYRLAVAEGRPLEAQTMQELLELLRKQPRAPTVPEELSRLVRRYINGRRGLPWKLNQLLQHVERTWDKVSDDPLDPTNNATERIIGLTFKIRSKTTCLPAGGRQVRGFKAMHKVVSHPYLAFFLRGREGICDLRKVI